jgi:hypothetical protein
MREKICIVFSFDDCDYGFMKGDAHIYKWDGKFGVSDLMI